MRQQLEALGRAPDAALRESPIAGVILTDAEIDHTLGLMVLREAAEPLQVWGTPLARTALSEGFPALRMLEAYSGVRFHELVPGKTATLEGSPLQVEAFAVSGDAPNYVQQPPPDADDWAVGLTFTEPATGAIATYVPAVAELDEPLLERLGRSDCVLIDGTFWSERELVSLGVARRDARAMGHLPLSGPDGSLQALAALPRPRKILVHINNTNPILREDSPERRAVEAAGVEVGEDRLLVEL